MASPTRIVPEIDRDRPSVALGIAHDTHRTHVAVEDEALARGAELETRRGPPG